MRTLKSVIRCYSNNVKSTSILFLIFCFTSSFLVQVGNAEAKTTSTTANGLWGDVTKWTNGLPANGDIININNVMDFTNVNVNIGTNTTYNFNAGANGSSIPLSLGMSSSSSILNIYSNVSFAGGINLNAGIINVYMGATLTVTNQINQAGTQINIASGANFNVTGNYTNNGGNIAVDGLLAITGTYDGQNASAIVTGSGDITTTGHMKGLNGSTIFGIVNPDCGGPCSGRNLCGRTASSSPASAAYCSTPIVLTGSVSSGSGGTYQWQSSDTNTESGFMNIPSATNATLSVSPTSTTYYRVKITISNCTSLSPVSVVTKSSCSKTWVGITTDWNVGTNWNPSIVPSSTDDVVIPNISNKPVISSSANAKNVIVNSGSSLQITSLGTLNLYGNLVNSGSLIANSGSTISMNGTGSQSISGASTLYNVSINQGSIASDVTLFSNTVVKGTISLIKGVLNTGDYLTVDFTSGGNVAYNTSDAGSINGLVTAYRSSVIAKTHYISTPFNGVVSAQVDACTPLWVNPYWKMYSKNFDNQNWTAITNTSTSMPVGTGFSLSFVNPSYLSFTGTYNHAFTFTSPLYSNVATQKYFLVGNPYPSTLDWDNAAGWTKNKIGGSIYYWNPATSQTATYVKGAAINSGSQFIPAMQAFMVVCDGTGGSSSLSINNNARISLQNPSYWRVAADDMIRIHLIAEDPTLNDETVIRFNEEATNNFDFDLDAYKILNSGLNPSIFTREGTQTYSINSYSKPDSAKSVPLLAKLATDGTYTFRFENNNPNIQYVLLDRQLSIEQPITNTYTFVGSSKDSVNRFELQLRETVVTITTGLQSANKTRGLQINSSVKGFIIQSDRFVGSIATIEVIDMTGNVVKNIPNQSIASHTTFVPVDLTDGSYIVKVTIDSELYTGLIVAMK
jgi:hypothetical protein